MSHSPPLRSRPVGGASVEWRPADPARTLAAAERTADGLTFLQTDHVAAAAAKRADGGPHTGTAGTITVFDGPLDRAAMAAALTTFVRRHDELRACYRLDDTGPIRLVAPAESIEFRTSGSGAQVATDDVIGHIVGRIESEAVFDRMPGVVYGAFDHDDGFTFYIGSDHSHTDGFSQYIGLHEIARLYRAHRDGEIPQPESTGRFTDYISSEKSLAASVTPGDPRITTWREILSANDGRVPRFPFDLGLADGELGPALPVQRAMLTAGQLEACAQRRDDHSSLVGLIYAALAAAQHELLGTESYFTSTVLSTRTADHATTQGWLCNFAPVTFPVPPGTRLTELVHIATDAVAVARDLATLPVHAALAVLAAEGTYLPDSGSPQMVSYIDFRRIPGSDDPAVASATCFPAVGRTRNANMWFTRYEHALTLLAHIPDNPTARGAFGVYVDAVGRWLTDYSAGADPVVGAHSATEVRS
ncbi:condensation domain-containing protein [Gordonia sp. DT101]|uniref:condensation domain-containing protein n=1 Tax=Gordonia sp. DT101 TaxID=3416545 RepID=UPI003CED5249